MNADTICLFNGYGTLSLQKPATCMYSMYMAKGRNVCVALCNRKAHTNPRNISVCWEYILHVRAFFRWRNEFLLNIFCFSMKLNEMFECVFCQKALDVKFYIALNSLFQSCCLCYVCRLCRSKFIFPLIEKFIPQLILTYSTQSSWEIQSTRVATFI